jgi:TolB-like protein
VSQSEYTGTSVAGVKVSVSSQDSMLSPEDEGITAPPGTLINIGLNLVVSDKLDGLYSDCFTDDVIDQLQRFTMMNSNFTVSYTVKVRAL